ncbi:MAG TPA: hypothetical protein VM261_10430 [Kofleriaceae bacterium]|nr:hypothetical protein [Kofleriaceae bacterium]
MSVALRMLCALAPACTVNGKAIGIPGASSSSNVGSAGSSDSSSSSSTKGQPPGSSCRAQAWADPWPFLDRPADPWLAVVDGQPARVSLPSDSYGQLKENLSAVCDAAVDHCLRDCTWLVTTPGEKHREATPFHVNPDGDFVEEDWRFRARTNPEGFVAYRTVPVTRENLKVGALAMAFSDPVYDGRDMSTHVTGFVRNLYAWDVGTVASIDWDSGVLWLDGHRDGFFLAAARVPVLRYTRGGTVEAMPGALAKAPAVADVIRPGRAAHTSDPWSQVDRRHQPVAADDPHAMAGLAETCNARVDHCLRPWVWFVDDGGTPAPARWTGKAFVRAADADMVIDHPGLAYRTRPAKESELRPGRRVLVFRNTERGPASQDDAHATRGDWMFAEVGKVDANFHVFTVKGSDDRYPVDNARLLVLFWLPGEDATAVE